LESLIKKRVRDWTWGVQNGHFGNGLKWWPFKILVKKNEVLRGRGELLPVGTAGNRGVIE